MSTQPETSKNATNPQKRDAAKDHENVRGNDLKEKMLESEAKGAQYRAEHGGADARVTMPQKEETSRK